VEYTFANHSSAKMQVHYLTTSGAVGAGKVIGPGSSYAPPAAAAGQAWVVQTTGGGCLGIIRLNTNGGVTVS
jgi:hypothetical protein